MQGGNLEEYIVKIALYDSCLCCFFAVCATCSGMAFTCSNVLRAVRTVEDWWWQGGLGDCLGISEEKMEEIQQVYSDPEEQKRQLILYWLSTDPLASWRTLILQLDDMWQSPVADGIRDFTEPLAAGAVLYHIFRELFAIKGYR